MLRLEIHLYTKDNEMTYFADFDLFASKQNNEELTWQLSKLRHGKRRRERGQARFGRSLARTARPEWDS